MSSKPVDVAEMRSLYAATTPGKWVAGANNLSIIAPDTCRALDGTQGVLIVERCGPDDTQWIAAAHNQMPALLDELEEARKKENWQTIAEMRRANNAATRKKLEEVQAELDALKEHVKEHVLEGMREALGTGEVTPVPDTSRPARFPCVACKFETEWGTEEVPHPVDGRVHTCKPLHPKEKHP